jgi:hypothetical protein
MHGNLGWRELKDQPATSGVNPRKSEYAADEGSVSLCIGAVENDMGSVDHRFSFCFVITLLFFKPQ